MKSSSSHPRGGVLSLPSLLLLLPNSLPVKPKTHLSALSQTPLPFHIHMPPPQRPATDGENEAYFSPRSVALTQVNSPGRADANDGDPNMFVRSSAAWCSRYAATPETWEEGDWGRGGHSRAQPASVASWGRDGWQVCCFYLAGEIKVSAAPEVPPLSAQ